LISKNDKFLANNVDEVPIVGNEDNGWRVRLFSEFNEETLEPDNSEEIEKIGRFVQDENVSWL
jgi:hypothetical protein